MVGRRRAVVFALSFVAVAPASVAARQLSEVTFGYIRGRGADACPSQLELQSAVIAKLGYDPFRSEATRHLEVVISIDDGVLRALVRSIDSVDHAASVHRLASARLDCETLHPALTLAIALAIDPCSNLEIDATPQLSTPPPPRPFPRARAPDVPLIERAPIPINPEPTPPDRARTPATVRGRPDRPIGILYGGALVAIAASPATTGGFELGGGALWRAFAILVEVRGDVPTRARSLPGEIEVARVAANIAPCFRVHAFAFCALASVGVSTLRGHGYAVDRVSAAPFAAFGARLLADVSLGRTMLLGFHADVLGLATRVDVRVDATVGYADSPATGAFGMFVGGRFGDGN